MALAKKCDRCGKLYYHYPIGNQSGIFNGIKLVRIGENGSFDYAKNHDDLCPECMEAIKSFLSNDAYIVYKERRKCMTIVEFRDRHYERVSELYSRETGEIRFVANYEEYLYLPTSHAFLKYDAFRGDYYVTDDIIQLMTSQTDEGIKELENMLQNEDDRQE